MLFPHRRRGLVHLIKNLAWMPSLILIMIVITPLAPIHVDTDSLDPAQHFISMIQRILVAIDNLVMIFQDAMIRISRAAYSLMAMGGLLVWASRYDKRLGRDLLLGSLMLAFVVECIIPLFV